MIVKHPPIDNRLLGSTHNNRPHKRIEVQDPLTSFFFSFFDN